MPRLVRLTLLEDKPDGLRSAFIAGRTTTVIACPWVRVPAVLGRSEATRPGIYIFVGEPNEGDTIDAEEVAYVGECDAFASRIKGHHRSDAAEWSQVLLATTTDGMFNKAHARRAEHLLVERARSASRVKLLNGSTSPGVLDAGEESFVDEFVENVCMLVQTLGLPVFREFTRRVAPDSLGSPAASVKVAADADGVSSSIDDQTPTFAYSVGGAAARMQPQGSEFVVLAGSTLVAEEASSFRGVAVQLRRRGMETGAIMMVDGGRLLKLGRDIPTSSVSAAAELVSGYSVNGREAWKVPGQGITYKMWSQRLLDSAASESLTSLGLTS